MYFCSFTFGILFSLTVSTAHLNFGQKPIHNALQHKIINSSNPNSDEVVECPDGTSARLILLGEEIPLYEGLMEWDRKMVALHHKLYLRQQDRWPSGSSHPTTLPQVSHIQIRHREGFNGSHEPGPICILHKGVSGLECRTGGW